MRKKTADEKREEFQRLEKMVDGFNEAVHFLRNEGRHVEIGLEDNNDVWIKSDGVLLDDTD